MAYNSSLFLVSGSLNNSLLLALFDKDLTPIRFYVLNITNTLGSSIVVLGGDIYMCGRKIVGSEYDLIILKVGLSLPGYVTTSSEVITGTDNNPQVENESVVASPQVRGRYVVFAVLVICVVAVIVITSIIYCRYRATIRDMESIMMEPYEL